MFKGNRVGTPHIHQLIGAVESSVAWTVNGHAPSTGHLDGNVINALSVQDFGQSKVVYVGASVAIASGDHFAIGQQITVPAPNDPTTNAVGLELNGAISMITDKPIKIQPVFMKITANIGTLLGHVTNDGTSKWTNFGMPNLFDNQEQYPLINDYKTQMLVQDDTSVAGYYLHGFHITNLSGAICNISYLEMQASLRTLVDQPGIGYQDSRR